MASFKVTLLSLVVLVAVLSVSECAVFGQGNIMRRRYPNGPDRFHRMKPTVWRGAPNSRTPVSGTNQNFGGVVSTRFASVPVAGAGAAGPNIGVNTRFGGAPSVGGGRVDYSWMRKAMGNRVY